LPQLSVPAERISLTIPVQCSLAELPGAVVALSIPHQRPIRLWRDPLATGDGFQPIELAYVFENYSQSYWFMR
jgi:hypothetical protein